MLTWTAKDPDATLDYRWEPPLDAGDTLASVSVTLQSGDVQIVEQRPDDTGLTVVLTGGSAGPNLFRGLWTSAGGRGDDEYISIEVRDDTPGAETLVDAFRIRYPAFRAVDQATIAYWLKDADRFVNDGWGEDADPARMAYAAHQMTVSGTPGLVKDAAASLPAGVTRFRSASMDVAISDSVASRSAAGGYSATSYGQEFAVMLRRNSGGPFLAGYVEPRGLCW